MIAVTSPTLSAAVGGPVRGPVHALGAAAARVGKAPIGKASMGKAPVAKAPVGKAVAKIAGKPLPKAAARPPLPKGRLVAAAAPAPAVSLVPRAATNPADPREQRIGRMREQVLDVLRSAPLGRLRVGVEVMEAETGEVLLSHNANEPFNPASNTKILTTAAALKLLGSDWSYRTVLLAGADQRPAVASLGPGAAAPEQPGVLRANLFLQGSGDPTLSTEGLAQLARTLSRAGITRIEGDLIADGQFRSIAELHKGAGPALGGGALLVNRNSYLVRVSPGAAGQPASVSMEPRSPYFVLDGHVQTVKGKRARVLIDHARQNGRLVVTVRGRIGASHGAFHEWRRLPDGGGMAAVALAQALADFGIELTGQVRTGPPPPGPLRVVAEHAGPLGDACRISNKDSNNFVADNIFKTLGGERFGLPGTLEKGARAVADWLKLMGLDPGRVRIVNGSGLTHENRVRPADLARLLRDLYHDMQVAPEFLQSLAVGGIDGTIRGRFRGGSVGLVRAKTGTLSGVSTLSGYVGERKGVLVFSIMVEGFRWKRLDEVRHAQVLIVESLLRFLRQGQAPGDLRAPAQPACPAPTSPSEDGESSEGEGDEA